MRIAVRASVPLTTVLLVLMCATAALPPLTVLSTGRLLSAVPAAVGAGFESDAARAALWALALLGGLFVLQRLLMAIRGCLATWLWMLVVHQIDERLMRALDRLPGIQQLEDPKVQDVIELARGSGINNQGWSAGTAVMALTNKLPQYLQGFGCAIVLGAFQPLLAAGYFALIVVATELRRREFIRQFGAFQQRAVALRRANYYRETAQGHQPAKEIRMFGLAAWLLALYNAEWTGAMTTVWREREHGQWRAFATDAVVAVAQIAYLVVIGSAAVAGRLTVAEVGVYLSAFASISLMSARNGDDFALAFGTGGVLSLLELEAKVAAESAATVSGPAPSVPAQRRVRPPEIRFEGVKFRYPGAERETVTDLNLVVPGGESLAIVGVNGAGKTTLVKLLCRLYEPQAGRISLDGVDVRDLSRSGLQHEIAAIFQDFVEYALPARENIAFGAVDYLHDQAGIESAARRAGALDIIEGLPHGWDTVLDRRFPQGAQLSGGQWQRIALARALFAVDHGASVLIMDEPTANLDVRAEADLYDRFLELTAGVTTILISHRFSTVRRAGLICLVDGGQVGELGTHDELVAAGGQYARLFDLQASRFREDAADD